MKLVDNKIFLEERANSAKGAVNTQTPEQTRKINKSYTINNLNSNKNARLNINHG